MIWRRALPYRQQATTPRHRSTRFEVVCNSWVSGNVALFRANKQVYNEAMPILYREEIFSVTIQPRRAFLEFIPVNRKLQPSFGLVTSNDGIDINKHPGLKLVTKWSIGLAYHSLKKRGKSLKCFGLQSFLKLIDSTIGIVSIDLLVKENSDFVFEKMLCAIIAEIGRAHV